MRVNLSTIYIFTFWQNVRIITIFSSFCILVQLFSGVDQVQSALLIQDMESALHHSKDHFQQNPDDIDRKLLYGQTLANLLKTHEAMSLFDLEELKPQNAFDLIESLAWSVLKKHAVGGESSEAMSLLGAAITQDVRGLKMLLEKMRSPNARIRGFALRLAGLYPDPIMKKQVFKSIASESNYRVRLEAIKTSEYQKNDGAIEPLKKVIDNPLSTPEERFLAIKSLAGIMKGADRIQVHYLMTSDRAQYRLLGLQIIMRQKKPEYLDEVKATLNDPSFDVRCKAFEALGMLATAAKDIAGAQELIDLSMENSPLTIQLAGHWLKSLIHDKNSIEFIQNSMEHDELGIRIAAASFAAKSKPVLMHIQQYLRSINDPFVKINLAIGFLKHRMELDYVEETFAQFLTTQNGFIMSAQDDNFGDLIAPSSVTHHPIVPNFPLLVDQMTRLQLISQYALFNLEGAKKSLEELLGKGLIHVNKMALMFLFQESDVDVLEVAKALMESPDAKNRLQILLVLAFFGKDTDVVDELIELFPKVSFEDKIQIIESLGHLGGEKTITFLLKKLNESSRLIQIAAAASIIQALYH